MISKLVKILLAATVLALFGLGYAQRPPELNERGEAYLRVNINPTEVAPMVNINPHDRVPRVEVTRMPEIQIPPPPPSGCDNPQNFRTGIEDSISGPLMLTYLNAPPQAKVTLSGGNGSQSINLTSTAQVPTAIFLRAGQRLEFDAAVMYSGCEPD